MDHRAGRSRGAPEGAGARPTCSAPPVDLYRGDLLAGFYDDWLFPDQERLRERFLATLGRLADLVMARGDYDQALDGPPGGPPRPAP